MRNKFLLFISAATLLIIIGGVFLFSKGSAIQNTSTPPPLPSSYEYFWGNGCPHCVNVEKFLESWDGRDKVKIDKYEVWYNRENAKLYQERVKSCNIPQDQMGVPLLFTPDGKCLNGDQPIIDFFKNLKF